MTLALIFSTDKRLGIGKNGEIPWHNDDKVRKEDLAWFKRYTENHVVIMGRKTWENIGRKALPNRMNIVITSNPVEKGLWGYLGSNLHWVKSPEDVLNLFTDKINYIIGGAQLYNYFLNEYPEKIDLLVHSQLLNDYDYECDAKIDVELYRKFITRPDVKVHYEYTNNFVNYIYTKVKTTTS